MKLDRDQIRGMLEEATKIAGYTLDDLEGYLTGQKKYAEMEKMAEDLMIKQAAVPGIADIMKLIGMGIEIPAAISVIGGAGVGALGYGAYKGLKDSDDRVSDAEVTKKKYQDAEQNLSHLRSQQGRTF